MTTCRRTMLRAALGLALSGVAAAQSPGRTRRIGFLSPFPRADVDAVLQAIRAELASLGWREGGNLLFLEPRTSEGDYARLPALAAEVVALRPDVILVQSTPATRALMNATSSIPIVMIGVGDPVAQRLVRSLAQPGGNVTGTAFLADETAVKALALLKELAPRIASVAVFARPDNEADPQYRQKLEATAGKLGMSAQFPEVRTADDFPPAFARIVRDRSEALLVGPEALLRGQRFAIGRFAREHRLPSALVGGKRFLDSDCLLTYGPAFDQYPPLAARLVDSLLRGAQPARIPVRQPEKFELGINRALARELGLAIPPALLIQAAA